MKKRLCRDVAVAEQENLIEEIMGLQLIPIIQGTIFGFVISRFVWKYLCGSVIVESLVPTGQFLKPWRACGLFVYFVLRVFL